MESTLPTIAKKLRALDKSDVATWLQRGKLLTEARALCAADRDFSTWLRSNNTPRRSAYRSMAAWRDFGSVSTWHRFTRESMELLGRSDEARNAALALSAKERISARCARNLLRIHAPAGTAPAPLRKSDTKRIFLGDGFKVTITFDRPATDGDILAALMIAHRGLRESTTRAA